MDKSNLLKILLVDDEEPFRKVVGDFLNSTNLYVTYFCESGEEAIALISQNRFDVILLDYKMAGVSGLNVLQWLHEQKIDTPIIMLTAAGSEQVAVEAMKLGAYDYIRKEHLQIEYLPTIIKSVHQQYLFSKEKEKRIYLENKLDGHLSKIQKYYENVKACEKAIQNSLSIITSELKRIENRIMPGTTFEDGLALSNPVIMLIDHLNLISAFVNVMRENFETSYNDIIKFKKNSTEYFKEPEKSTVDPVKRG